MFLTERVTKIPIKITLSVVWKEPMTFATDLRDMLGSAGFPTNTDTEIWGVNYDPSAFTGEDFGTTDTPTDVYLFGSFTNMTNLIRDKEGHLGRLNQVETTNGMMRPIVFGTNDSDIYAAIGMCLEQIHIKTSSVTNYGTTFEWPHMLVIQPK